MYELWINYYAFKQYCMEIQPYHKSESKIELHDIYQNARDRSFEYHEGLTDVRIFLI